MGKLQTAGPKFQTSCDSSGWPPWQRCGKQLNRRDVIDAEISFWNLFSAGHYSKLFVDCGQIFISASIASLRFNCIVVSSVCPLLTLCVSSRLCGFVLFFVFFVSFCKK